MKCGHINTDIFNEDKKYRFLHLVYSGISLHRKIPLVINNNLYTKKQCFCSTTGPIKAQKLKSASLS